MVLSQLWKHLWRIFSQLQLGVGLQTPVLESDNIWVLTLPVACQYPRWPQWSLPPRICAHLQSHLN